MKVVQVGGGGEEKAEEKKKKKEVKKMLRVREREEGKGFKLKMKLFRVIKGGGDEREKKEK